MKNREAVSANEADAMARALMGLPSAANQRSKGNQFDARCHELERKMRERIAAFHAARFCHESITITKTDNQKTERETQ